MRIPKLRILNYQAPPVYTEYFAVDKAQLREPNLWIPKVKPVGPVKINWNHPITNGLCLCVLFGKDVLYDLINKTQLTLTGTPTNEVTNKGKVTYFNGTSQGAYIDIDLSSENAICVASGFEWPSYSDNDDLFMEYGNPFYSNDGFIILPNASDEGGGKFSTGVDEDVYSVAATFTRPSTSYHDFVFRLKKQVSSLGMMVDGIEYTPTYFNNSSGVNGSLYNNTRIYINYRGSGSLYGESKVSYLYIWKGDKYPGIAYDISSNPYQFLEPA